MVEAAAQMMMGSAAKPSYPRAGYTGEVREGERMETRQEAIRAEWDADCYYCYLDGISPQWA